jgi:putative flippase GtrA
MEIRLLHRLAPLLDGVPPERRLILLQFARFGVIGTLGFVWDTLIVYAVRGLVGLYAAGVISYAVAGTINWLLNRIWTYRHVPHGAMHRQAAMFLAVNSVGFVLNRGIYFALIATQPFCFAHPVVPIAVGGVSAMFVNFFLSRRLVFR